MTGRCLCPLLSFLGGWGKLVAKASSLFVLIYLFLSELGLVSYARDFAGCGGQASHLVAFVAEHRLQVHGPHQLQASGSVVVAQGA